MLLDAHKALEAMSAASAAVKDERWGEAQRALQHVQQLTSGLLRAVGDKVQDELKAPREDKRDRE